MALSMSFKVGVIILSDRAFSGEREDECIPVFRELITPPDFEIAEAVVISDDPTMIEETLKSFIAKEYSLIITSGGTGCSPRDNTPEITARLIDKPTPGVDSAIRRFSETKSRFAIYSRAVSGLAGKSFLINLPGSPRAVREIVEFLLPTIMHPLKLVAGDVKDCNTESTRIKP